MSDYIQELRELVGSRPLLMPAAGVVIVNQQGEILLQQRKDNDKSTTPPKSIDLDGACKNCKVKASPVD